MKICSYGPRFWVTNFKKKTSVFYHQIKKNPPLPTFNPQRFSERSICHTTFCSRHLRKNWRNWRELCKVLSRPWMASDFLPPTVMALNFRRRWGPWSSCGPSRYDPCTDRKRKCKKEVGGRRCWLNLGELPADCYFFCWLGVSIASWCFLTIPPLDSKDVFWQSPFFLCMAWRTAQVALDLHPKAEVAVLAPRSTKFRCSEVDLWLPWRPEKW